MTINFYHFHLICYKNNESNIHEELIKASKNCNIFRYYDVLIKYPIYKKVIYKSIMNDDIIAEYYSGQDIKFTFLAYIYGFDLIKSEKIIEGKFNEYINSNPILIDIKYSFIDPLTEELKFIISSLSWEIDRFVMDSRNYESTFILDIYDKRIIKYINFILNINQIQEFSKTIYNNSEIRSMILTNIKDILLYDRFLKKLYIDCKKLNIFPLGLAYLHSLFDFELIDSNQYKRYIGHIICGYATNYINNKFL